MAKTHLWSYRVPESTDPVSVFSYKFTDKIKARMAAAESVMQTPVQVCADSVQEFSCWDDAFAGGLTLAPHDSVTVKLHCFDNGQQMLVADVARYDASGTLTHFRVVAAPQGAPFDSDLSELTVWCAAQ